MSASTIAEYYRLRKNYEEALKWIQKAIDSELFEYWGNSLELAKIYEDLKKNQEALDKYKEALELNPRSKEAKQGIERLNPILDKKNNKKKKE